MVRTGNVAHAGTESKVFIKLFGTNKAGHAVVTSPMQLTGAAPADIFLKGS